MTVRNLAATQSAYRNMMINRTYASQSANKLSSGYNINSASDNAAGLSISEGMRGQISGLDKAYQNAQNGVSLVQTADSALDSSGNIMNRMRELAVQASNGTYTDSDRARLNEEFSALKSELDRISDSSNFNGQKLLDGSLGGTKGAEGLAEMGIASVSATGNLSGDAKFTITEDNGEYSISARIGDQTVTNRIDSGDTGVTFDFGVGNTVRLDFSSDGDGLSVGVISGIAVDGSDTDVSNAVSANNADGVSFQVGANGSADQQFGLRISDMSAAGLGVDDLDISSIDGANSAIEALTAAIDSNSGMRGTLGAMENRLTYTANNLGRTRESLIASESSIRDLDMAKEFMNYTRSNIMMNASQSMMAQGMNLARGNMMALLMG